MSMVRNGIYIHGSDQSHQCAFATFPPKAAGVQCTLNIHMDLDPHLCIAKPCLHYCNARTHTHTHTHTHTRARMHTHSHTHLHIQPQLTLNLAIPFRLMCTLRTAAAGASPKQMSHLPAGYTPGGKFVYTHKSRVGHSCIYTAYMTVYLMKSLQK